MRVVEGKNMFVSILRSGIYTPAICATNGSFGTQTEMKSTRTTGSGRYNSFITGKKEWSVSLSGLVTIGGIAKQQFYDFINPAFSDVPKTVRVDWIDEKGSKLWVSGLILIESVESSGEVNDFAEYSVTLRGTGPYTVSLDLGEILLDTPSGYPILDDDGFVIPG
jgi:predicted secreted protein